MYNFDYIKALTAQATTTALAKDKTAKIIAGGTNLVDLMKRGVEQPQKLVDITNIPLKEITAIGNDVRIGALVLNSVLSEDAAIEKNYPLLSMALKSGASAQLRNMATVGGNMMQRTRCSYFYDLLSPCNKRKPGSGCGALNGHNHMHAIFGASESCIAVHPSDMCVALAALDASVLLSGENKERKIRFTDFHRLPGSEPQKDNTLLPGEMITGVELNADNIFSTHFHYLKIRERTSYAFALISVAAALQMDGSAIKKARLAMGGVAHKPWRLTETENFLAGKKADAKTFEQAAAIAMKNAKGYGHNNYKLKLAPAAIAEALMLASKK